MNKSLTLENLVISKGGSKLISINEVILPGEVLTVMGPSGIGKSTLLSCVNGNLPKVFQVTGRVLIGEDDITNVPTHLRHIGILFQDDLLFPHLSVGQNLAFGLTPGGSVVERKTKIAEALTEVGLDGFEDRDPATLSGGQKARVALMRMLLSEPKALLLDEAFSRLDQALRAHTREMVFARAKVRGLPVLMVTHDLEDAAAAGGKVITLGKTNAADGAP